MKESTELKMESTQAMVAEWIDLPRITTINAYDYHPFESPPTKSTTFAFPRRITLEGRIRRMEVRSRNALSGECRYE